MEKLRAVHRNLVLAAATSFLVGASSVHCGGSGANTSTFGTGAGHTSSGTNAGGSTSSMGGSTGTLGMGGGVGFDVMVMDYSAEQIYASDPPPTTCDGGGMPPPVGGTPQCPSDKNLPGCPCTTAGQTAACWTGLRKNRGHGNCKDGMTTCVLQGETGLVWGPCTGEVLPTGTTGKAACTCFSGGHWAIANLSPCFVFSDPTMTTVMEAIATDATTMQCPTDFTMAPTNWSTDTLVTDCTGNFTLCYTIKAGNGNSPQPTDCVVAKSCVTAYYPVANQVFPMPDLPGWITDSTMTACAQMFVNSGGYGEMSVEGQSDQCELVPNHVFQHVTYCPLACNGPSPPAMCAQCMPGGGGSF
jgi:hypothetical protein